MFKSNIISSYSPFYILHGRHRSSSRGWMFKSNIISSYFPIYIIHGRYRSSSRRWMSQSGRISSYSPIYIIQGRYRSSSRGWISKSNIISSYSPIYIIRREIQELLKRINVQVQQDPILLFHLHYQMGNKRSFSCGWVSKSNIISSYSPILIRREIHDLLMRMNVPV